MRLAGIKPQHDAVIKLGDGKDYREREHEVELPIKDAGAYLVVVKDGELDASGMVLVSNLELEIGEQVESGRVRATVIRKDDRSYVSRAHVKAIGEGMDAKVNDVLMSSAAGALRRYLQARGEPVDGVTVRTAPGYRLF